MWYYAYPLEVYKIKVQGVFLQLWALALLLVFLLVKAIKLLGSYYLFGIINIEYLTLV